MMKKLLGLLLALSMILSACAALADDEPAADATVTLEVQDDAKAEAEPASAEGESAPAAEATVTLEVQDGAEAAPAAEGEKAEPVLLVTVNGREILSDDDDLEYWQSYYLYQLANEGYDTSMQEVADFVKPYAMLYTQRLILINQKAEEMGLASFTDEEIASYQAAASESWESVISNYMGSTITDESSDEDKAAARADAEAALLAQGYDAETYISGFVDNQKSNEIIMRVRDAVSADAAVTDEDIQEYYDSLVKEDRDMYSEDIYSYELATRLYQQPSYYTPEGYRGVIHILLPVDEELMNTWKDLSARLEEQKEAESAEAAEETADATEEPADAEAAEKPEETAAEPTEAAEVTAEPASTESEPTETPAPTAEPVNQEQVDAAKQAILDSVQDKVDEINAKLKDGASFEDLIREYGTDPGMQDEAALRDGYPVHQDSYVWDPAFIAGAMSLEKVGDWSEPVLGSYGVHIIYYLRDVPSGAAELTDEMKEEFRATLLDEQKDSMLTDAMDKWAEEADIAYTEAGEAWKMPETAADTAEEGEDASAQETAEEAGQEPEQPADETAEQEDAEAAQP